ncbi:MAG: hypothetical protein KC502_02450 [Myxococcales bacterium]|nr:hypothetical protein [Myxococcales bacterium]
MRTTIERIIYLLVIATLGGMVIQAGNLHSALENAVPVTPKELYAQLKKKGRKPQIIDARALKSVGDDDEAFEESHIPGAIPMPGCAMIKAPVAAQAMIQVGVPTIIVSQQGDEKTLTACQAKFSRARNLAGGMAAWEDADYPEEDGEYLPPKMGGGGGCL